MDPLQWLGASQNESPNSWLKHYNNPQVIHTTASDISNLKLSLFAYFSPDSDEIMFFTREK